jgi:hypothetical protein
MALSGSAQSTKNRLESTCDTINNPPITFDEPAKVKERKPLHVVAICMPLIHHHTRHADTATAGPTGHRRTY